jgi:hypothetical protein
MLIDSLVDSDAEATEVLLYFVGELILYLALL